MVFEFLLVGGAVFSGLDALENYLKLRRQQRELATSADHEPFPKADSSTTLEEHPLVVNCRFQTATSSLGFALAGSLVNPLLLIPGALGLLAVTGELFSKSYRSLRDDKQVNTYTLVSISLAGCLLGQYYILGSSASLFYALSRKMLLHTREQASKNLGELFLAHQPRSAWVILDGLEREIPLEELRVGDLLVVDGGQVIPADGVVMRGQASVDQQLLTGEAAPVDKFPGEVVFAATLVLGGRLEVQVTRAGEETVAGEIASLLQQTFEYRGHARQKAERLADVTALPTLATGLVALPLLGPLSALAVVSTHVGYRMSVLESLNSLNHFQMLSAQGVLVKDARMLDYLHQVDTVVFDKTGVLTQVQPRVFAVHCYAGYDENQLLALAAGVEQRQSHPLARAIVEAAGERGLSMPSARDVDCEVGQGLSMPLPTGQVRVGSAAFLRAAGIILPPAMKQHQTRSHQQGHTLVLVALDDTLLGAIELQPVPRSEAVQLVADLQQRGLQVQILSGDHWQPTRYLAEQLGIEQFQAELLPQGKAQIIHDWQQQGRVVCYVGDGLNDAAALREARVAVSLTGASRVAVDAADALLLGDSLQPLKDLLAIGSHFTETRDSSFNMILVPAVVGATGVLCFEFGLLETLLLKQLGLGAGLTRVMAPRWRRLSGSTDEHSAASQPAGLPQPTTS